MEVFERHGWLVKHAPVPMVAVGKGRFVPDPRGRGILDLLLIHPTQERVLFAECKSETGRLSADQGLVIRNLRPAVERVRRAFPNGSSPLGVHLFRPGAEELIEKIAKGEA